MKKTISTGEAWRMLGHSLWILIKEYQSALLWAALCATWTAVFMGVL